MDPQKIRPAKILEILKQELGPIIQEQSMFFAKFPFFAPEIESLASDIALFGGLLW